MMMMMMTCMRKTLANEVKGVKYEDVLYRDLNQKAAIPDLHRDMCTLHSSPDDIRTMI